MMIEVTCAIIRNEDMEVLAVRRSADNDHPMKWEFPGGKVKEGESLEDCLVREIEEEISLDIVIVDSLDSVEWDYGFRKVRLHPFICDTLLDLPLLNEHEEYRWVRPSALSKLDFLEADFVVIDRFLEKTGGDELAETSGNITGVGVDEEKIRQLLTGRINSEASDLLAESALENNSITDLLVRFSLSEDKTLSFRASWTLTKVAEKDPDDIVNWYGPLIEAMPGQKFESVLRCTQKIINLSDFTLMNSRYHGLLADCSFRLLSDKRSAIAVKAYSMESIYSLTHIYPDLRDELSQTITGIMEDGSAGIKARGRYIIERMRKDILREIGNENN